jgi:glutamate synthase (NADPH/NADH) small chain
MVRPPEQRTKHMPWPTYPMLLKTTSSHEEVDADGHWRHWGIETIEFLSDEQGNLRALKVVDVSWEEDINGRPVTKTVIHGSEREIPCQRVFLAMGFLNPQYEGMLESLGVELDGRNNVRATEKAYRTNVSKVFTAGDMRRGQSLVVWAISEGREAARKVDEFLMGHSILESKDAVNQFDEVF